MKNRLIPQEALPHFENAIYIPMLITILKRDRESIRKLPIKLKKPYLNIIDKAMDSLQKDLSNTNSYLHSNNMKLIKEKTDEDFTQFIFLHDEYKDRRRYLNVRLKNRTEELLGLYLAQAGKEV